MNLVLPLLLPLLVVDFSNADKPLYRRDVNQSQSKNRKDPLFDDSASIAANKKNIVPREFIRFELSDAKIPDERQQRYFQQQRQKQLQKEQTQAYPEIQSEAQPQEPTQSQESSQAPEEKQKQPQTRRRKPQQRRLPAQNQKQQQPQKQLPQKQQPQKQKEKSTEEQDTSASTVDMTASGSRVLKITHPPSQHDNRQRSIKELPFGVQKAINHALHQDFNIPYLDTIKYYIKDPVGKSSQYTYTVNTNGKNPTLSNSNKEWWQLAPLVRTTPQTLYGVPSKSTLKVSPTLSTTIKSQSTPTSSSLLQMGDYLAYPAFNSYPVQYSLNVASNVPNRLPSYYTNRLYPKVPYLYDKNINFAVSDELQSTPLPPSQDQDILNDIVRQQNGVSSTSPVLFPVTQPPNIPNPIVKFYAAIPKELKELKDLNVDVNDKETLALVRTAVESLKKHNPHLDVVPKKVENNELIVHVTPKPGYSQPADPTVQSVTDKNLLYLNKFVTENDVDVIKVTARPTIKQLNEIEHSHAFVKQLHDPIENNEFGYTFGYRVRDRSTGNDFGHTQKRMTDGTTHGEYKILMPDGRTQNVKYKADDQGYHADVSYDMRK